MPGPGLTPAFDRGSPPSRNHRGRSPAELIFFSLTGHDPSIRMERGVRFIRLGANILLYVGMVAAKEMARGMLRRGD
jgi:hypothetical protein